MVDILRYSPGSTDEGLARVEDLERVWMVSDSGVSSRSVLLYVPERLRRDRVFSTERKEYGYRSAIAKAVYRNESTCPRQVQASSGSKGRRGAAKFKIIPAGYSRAPAFFETPIVTGRQVSGRTSTTHPRSPFPSTFIYPPWIYVVSAMDPDGKSPIPPYYGGRQSGNNDYSGNPARPPRNRYDSSSSYYNQDVDRPRSSTELLNGGTRSAGYNQNSFFDAGRTEPLKGGDDEEDPLRGKGEGSWDIFADFNNAGPRYSEAFVDPAPEPEPV